jgi:hypothetical protein
MPRRHLLVSVIWIALLAVWAAPSPAEVDTAWVRTYNGPTNEEDRSGGIALDDSGNVYVTGLSEEGWINMDYATVKYDASGNELWTRRYDGTGKGIDVAWAIAADGSGNVYVTGTSWGSGTHNDYATIKYHSDGDTAWIRRYNGGGNSPDEADALAVDGSGNVYVTGSSRGTDTDLDYATIKYYPNGDTAWVRSYNGPTDSDDDAEAIAADGSGNVYVTGSSPGSGTSDDYTTIKYYPNGDTAWVRRYDGPAGSADWGRAIAVDGSGNVYVTGASPGNGTEVDFATLKYYPDGDTAWVRRYNGPGNSYDRAYAVAVDGSGNVYVTGESVGSGTGYDYVTIKYYPDGDSAWLRRYNGPVDADDYPQGLAVDLSGNVYVTGTSRGDGTDNDFATVKYDAAGNELWVERYDGPQNRSDRACGIAVDDSGYLYVTGATDNGVNDDYLTIKYVQTPAGVKDETGNRERPSQVTLSQNYPNPFNQTTKVEFTLAKSGFVSLNIYDILGRRVRTLASEHLSSGYKSVLWDGKDDSGSDVASGVYFCQLKVGNFSDTRKLVLLK